MMSRERSVVSHGGLLWETPYLLRRGSVSRAELLRIPFECALRRVEPPGRCSCLGDDEC